MNPPDDLYAYIWQRLPLMLMFANGYIVYRLFVITKLTERFVFWSLRKSRGRISRVCLYIVMVAALLSFFIPNAVTVLILLPVLKRIEADVASQSGISMATALTLSAIYGANIGGMGSLIGSPANLLLIGALDLYGVPGREQIGFFNWFVWGVPLAALFSFAAWGLASLMAIPGKAREIRINLEESEGRTDLSREQKSGAVLFVLFLGFWIAESLLKEVSDGFARLEPPVCLCFFLLFLYLSFFRSPMLHPAIPPLKGGRGDVLPDTHTPPRPPRGGISHGEDVKTRLLQPGDMISGLPKRGIVFLGILLLFLSVVRFFELDKGAADILSIVISEDLPLFAVFFLTTLAVIFLTEVLSNTLVSTTFFSIAYFLALNRGMPPLALMIAVSIASTCAFMTPVATPCNALAFGEMKGTSFRVMLVSGFLLNLIGALLMSLWLQFVIPHVYRF